MFMFIFQQFSYAFSTILTLNDRNNILKAEFMRINSENIEITIDKYRWVGVNL